MDKKRLIELCKLAIDGLTEDDRQSVLCYLRDVMNCTNEELNLLKVQLSDEEKQYFSGK